MRRLLAGTALLVVLAACGDDSPNIFARVESPQATITAGEQRVLVSLIDIDTNLPAASPDVPVTATLRDRIGSPIADFEGIFLWAIPEARGMYAFHLDIPGPGDFQLTFNAGRLGSSIGPIRLTALGDSQVVDVGDDAPRSITRTIPQYDLGDITSDPNPDPSFYEMTVAEAVESGPSVIIFGTPAWCTSQTCGPLLQQVKALSPEFPDLNYVHVEVYENIHVATREELVFVPSVTEWRLVIEPIIFVTDASGRVSAVFDGAVAEVELRNAFQAVSG